LGDDDEVLGAFGCDSVLRVLPGGLFGGALRVGDVANGIEFVLGEIKKIVSCRSADDGVLFNDQIFNIRYGLEGILYYLTTGVTPLNITTNFDDWTDVLSNTTSKINLPNTCTYAYWIQNGVCSVQYAGIKSLLGIDVTLRVRIRRCTASATPGSIEVYLGCKGTDCFLFKDIRFCSSQSDCTDTTICYNIFNENMMNYNGNNSNSNNNTNCYNGTCEVVSQSDYTNMILTPAFLYTTLKENTSCMRDVISEVMRDTKNAVRELKNLQLDNTYQFFMCSFDTSFIMKDGNIASDWIQSQVIVDAGTITVRDLNPWTIDTNVLSFNAGGGGNVTGSGVRSVLFSFMVLFGIVLFI